MFFIQEDELLSKRKQARILEIPRSSLYYNSVINNDSEFANLISEIYLSSECRYGYRKITEILNQQGKFVNKKKVLRIMQETGIQGLYPKRYICTTSSALEHKKYPYLLTGLEIVRPNQVWATDITYIKLYDRFMYVIAVIDLFSRYIVGYDISHTLEAQFCTELISNLLKVSKPEIFNSDQGVQFTSHGFVDQLLSQQVQISMDHRGRCFDNIIVERFWRTLKQEAIYYYRPETIRELEEVINEFIIWYNHKRIHQSLQYATPYAVYTGAVRGSLPPLKPC